MSKDIFVIVEQRDGKIQHVGIELIGESTKLAKDLGQKVVAVLLGHNIAGSAQQLIEFGADKVLIVDHPMLAEYVTEPYTKAVTQIIKDYDPEIVMFGATSMGRDVAPRVAGRVHTGLTADCTKLDIGEATKRFADGTTKKYEGQLLMTRPAFGGNIMATIVCTEYRPQMATVRPGVMPALEPDKSRTGEIETVQVDFTDADMNVELVEVRKETRKIVDVTQAKVLVSGGRGIGGPEAFEAELRPVANLLGGEISSSRACVEAGWIPQERQVGQTGKTVRPNLYMACGISGAIQHLAGMSEAELIIAINKNEAAPIFGVADLGIVNDLHKVLPKLAESLEKYFAERAVKI